VRLLFASSIAVVGQFPTFHPGGPREVPETALGEENTAEIGYSEAKWVCERILDIASEIFASSRKFPPLRTCSVRLGQLTGPEGNGTWSVNEHLPIILRTSLKLRALPDINGTLSWIPVNRAARAVTELLFSTEFHPYYHLENPTRQPWQVVIRDLASILGGPDNPLPLIPFPEWLRRVRDLGSNPAKNPAFQILNFLGKDFLRMASGVVVLETSKARLHSPTLAGSSPLTRKHLEEYVEYWRRSEYRQIQHYHDPQSYFCLFKHKLVQFLMRLIPLTATCKTTS
jgi:thioester reductase-like protein